MHQRKQEVWAVPFQIAERSFYFSERMKNMPKYSNQRQRIMALYRILYEETDEQHGLTMDELLSRLEDRGIVAECRSIYDDIKALNSTFKENPKDKYAFTISILKTHTM